MNVGGRASLIASKKFIVTKKGGDLVIHSLSNNSAKEYPLAISKQISIIRVRSSRYHEQKIFFLCLPLAK